MKAPRSVLIALIQGIPGAKVVPCNGADLNPFQDIGQKNIDYLTEPGNTIFAIDVDGQCHHMAEGERDFQDAIGQRAFVIAFSVPEAMANQILAVL